MVFFKTLVVLGVISPVFSGLIMSPGKGGQPGYDEDEFTPVFRMYSGNDWDSKDDYLSQERSARDGDRDDSQFRSWAMDQWRHLGVKKVKVEIYDDGDEVAEFEFDADMQNHTGFFNPRSLKRSTYDDIPNEGLRPFSGDEFGFSDDTDDDRHWKINGRHMGDCRNDDGWLQVVDKPRPGRARCVCGYENVEKYPAIMYARGNRKTRWGDKSFGYADMMQISVSQRPYSKPTPPPQPAPQPQPQPQYRQFQQPQQHIWSMETKK